MSNMSKLKILFLCAGNACQSQMAEGWARHLKRDFIVAYSAGTKPRGLNRVAVKVMMQAGVDLTEHRSKSIRQLGAIEFDCVVTVCDGAHEACPAFPGNARIFHKGFDDPSRLAAMAVSDEEAMGHYERVRDEIRAFVESLPDGLDRLGGDDPVQLTLGI